MCEYLTGIKRYLTTDFLSLRLELMKVGSFKVVELQMCLELIGKDL